MSRLEKQTPYTQGKNVGPRGKRHDESETDPDRNKQPSRQAKRHDESETDPDKTKKRAVQAKRHDESETDPDRTLRQSSMGGSLDPIKFMPSQGIIARKHAQPNLTKHHFSPTF